MNLDEIKEKLKKLEIDIKKLIELSKYEEKQDRLKVLEEETCKENFYNQTDKTTEVLGEIKLLNIELKKIKDLIEKLDEAKIYLEIAESENNSDAFKEIDKIINYLEQKKENLEIESLLSDEYDSHNAILSIHPGAGGTESQDWAEMLYRMYQKWSIKSNYELELLNYEIGDEAGIKSVSFLIKGINAYGYLKSEAGVHRLVRISPFDSNSRRHTSFAAVEVMPEITNDIIINIRPEDLEIDTFRASGAGGQHINKTESAIRIKHIPTGIVVGCQTERSQIQNREYAMKMLTSKLFEYEKRKKDEEKSKIKGESLDIAWGSQIRSYVFCPYTLVKDHRTGYEEGNVTAVMNGKIDNFIYEYLKKKSME